MAEIRFSCQDEQTDYECLRSRGLPVCSDADNQALAGSADMMNALLSWMQANLFELWRFLQ
jgi:hypothetical protein